MNPQGLACIAQCRAGPVTNNGCGQCGPMPAVLLIDVLNHFLASLVFEVDIDVRRLIALFGDEAFKEHAHARRVDLGDAQAITNRRVGRRAPALAGNALGTGKGHDVVDREEVRLVMHLVDELQLVLNLLAHLGRHALGMGVLGEALLSPVFGEVAQPLGGREARRDNLVGVFVAQFIQRKRTLRCECHSIGQHDRWVEPGESKPWPQIGLGIGKQPTAAVLQRQPMANCTDQIGDRLVASMGHAGLAHGHCINAQQAAQGLELMEPCTVIGTK